MRVASDTGVVGLCFDHSVCFACAHALCLQYLNGLVYGCALWLSSSFGFDRLLLDVVRTTGLSGFCVFCCVVLIVLQRRLGQRNSLVSALCELAKSCLIRSSASFPALKPLDVCRSGHFLGSRVAVCAF